jgi:hypothetical protein
MAQLIAERVRISEAAAVAVERLRCQGEAMRIVSEAIDANPAAMSPLLAHVGHQLLRAIEGKERQPS